MASVMSRFISSGMAPHVSGAAALILAAVPNITVDELKGMLLDGVDPVPALEGRTLTGGRLNAQRPLAARDDTPPDRVVDLTLVVSNSNNVVLG